MICYFQIEQKWQASWPRHVELLVTSLSKKSNEIISITSTSFFSRRNYCEISHVCSETLLTMMGDKKNNKKCLADIIDLIDIN